MTDAIPERMTCTGTVRTSMVTTRRFPASNYLFFGGLPAGLGSAQPGSRYRYRYLTLESLPLFPLSSCYRYRKVSCRGGELDS